MLDLGGFGVQLFEQLHKVLLLVEDTQLVQLDVLLLSLESQQEHLLHQVVDRIQPLLQRRQRSRQNLIYLIRQVRYQALENLVVILHKVYLVQ
jgi:hypothetical protein